jgi:hypothetical protein
MRSTTLQSKGKRVIRISVGISKIADEIKIGYNRIAQLDLPEVLGLETFGLGLC